MFSDFTIILPLKVREKVQYFVDKADKEISGLGDATINLEAKTVAITSAFLLDQECTYSSTDLCENAVAKAMFDAHKDEQQGKTRSIKFWWHSHVNMGVFWSGTDTATMKELSEAGWFVNIVFNKKREMLGAISYPAEITALGVTKKSVEFTSNIDVMVPGLFSAAEIKVLDKEMEDKYKEKTYTNYASYTNPNNRNSAPGLGTADQQRELEYWESLYGSGFANVDNKESYKVGELLPDGTVCLHWDSNLQVVCYEGTETEPDDVWFNTKAIKQWMSLENDPHLMNNNIIGLLSLDALEAVYFQLEHNKQYPQKAKSVKARMNKLLKKLAVADLKGKKDAPTIILN